MKKILTFILLSSIFFMSCKKAFEQPKDWSSFVVIQASPVATTAPTDTLQVYIDNMKYNSNNVLYNTNTTYLPVMSGAKNVNIRRGTTTLTADYISPFNYGFERGKAYSFVLYDTTTSSNGQARVLRLKDDLTLPAAGLSHVRILHLAPNGAAVDVTLLRTSAAPTGSPVLVMPDSVTISNKMYVGASPNEDALAAFTPIQRGTVYTVKVKAAGTQNVLLTSTLTLTQAATVGSDVNEGRIVTIYITGTAKGRPLAIGTFRHY